MNRKKKKPIARFLFSADRPLNGNRMINVGNGVETISMPRYIVAELISFIATLVFSMLWYALTFATVSRMVKPTEYLLLRIIVLAYLFISILLPKKGRVINTLCFASAILIWFLLSLILHRGALASSSLYQFFAGAVDSFKWVFSLSQDRPANLSAYWALLSIIVAWLVMRVMPNIVITCAVWILPWFFIPERLQGYFNMTFMMAGIVCILLALSRQTVLQANWLRRRQEPSPAVISVILILTFVLQSVLTPEMLYSERLKDKLDNIVITDDKPDIINYYEFSLDDAGFYPMHNRIGGPVELKKDLYMRVYGPEQSMYLRGAVYDQYDGKRWHHVPMKPNGIFVNEPDTPDQFQLDAFSTDSEHSKVDLLAYTPEATLRIFPERDPTQVIFNPGKPSRIAQLDDPGSNDRMKVYFNAAGQLYANKNIVDKGYTVYGKLFNPRHMISYIFDDLPSEVEFPIDEQFRSLLNQKQYTATYDGLDAALKADTELYSMLQNFGHKNVNVENPIEHIRFIYFVAEHFKEKFTYDLNMPIPDDDGDILTDFFELQKGYCVYFATAIVLIAREIGLPARYVEGFVVQGTPPWFMSEKQQNTETAGDNIIDIENQYGSIENWAYNTSQYYMRPVYTDTAHAWGEIYFPNIGWITIDGTPASYLDLISTDQNRDDPPTTTTTTTTTPATRTHQPTPPQPDQRTTPPQNRGDGKTNSVIILRIVAVILAIVLVLFLLYLLIRNRKRRLVNRHDIQFMVNKYGNRRLAADAVWQDMKSIQALAGITLNEAENIDQRMRHMAEHFKLSPNFRILDTVADKVYYAETEPTEEELTYLFNYYDTVETALKQSMSKVQWFFRRFLF